MNEKISSEEVEKHILILAMNTPFDIESPINVLFDKNQVATAYFDIENKILFLESINLEVFGLERRGIGTIVINYLEEYFSQFIENDKTLIFLVQYDNGNSSEEFYKKIGFKDLEKSKEFDKESKNNLYFIIDRFCGDCQILYKTIKA